MSARFKNQELSKKQMSTLKIKQKNKSEKKDTRISQSHVKSLKSSIANASILQNSGVFQKSQIQQEVISPKFQENMENKQLLHNETQKSLIFPRENCVSSNEIITDQNTPKQSISRLFSPKMEREVQIRQKASKSLIIKITNEQYTRKCTEEIEPEESSIFNFQELQHVENQRKNMDELEEIKRQSLEFQKDIQTFVQITSNALEAIKQTKQNQRLSLQSKQSQRSDSLNCTQESDTIKCKNPFSNQNKIASILSQIQKLENYVNEKELETERINQQNYQMQSLINKIEFYSLNGAFQEDFKCSNI